MGLYQAVMEPQQAQATRKLLVNDWNWALNVLMPDIEELSYMCILSRYHDCGIAASKLASAHNQG